MENNKMNQPRIIYRQEIIDIINKYHNKRFFVPANNLEGFVVAKFIELCKETGEFVNKKCQSINILKRYMTHREQIRTLNCVRLENIKYMEELCQHNSLELLRIPNFGIKSLITLRNAWIKSGHTIKEDKTRIHSNGKDYIAYFELTW